ncbi:MAG: metal ABC transporter permease [Lachnospiraceae bacterium]|nr:metal ABC transporter permease [Lachnospiraceae bacterium]
MSETMGIVETLQFYLSYPFVRYALIVGTLIALCSSLLGVTLVLKRFSYIGDGLSHVAFGALAIATVLDISNTSIVVMPVTVAAAILILRTGQNPRVHGDAAIAMLSVGSLAVGYLVMNLFSTSANISGDVCSTLFGSTSILTLTKAEVWLCVIMSVIVAAVFILLYNRIFAVTFDENFARAAGIRANAYNMLIAVITAVIIVLAMNLVGSLLISALVIFPALSAMRVIQNFKGVVIYSAVISVLCALAGIVLSILFSTPVGSTIVAADIAAFAVNCVVGRLIKR